MNTPVKQCKGCTANADPNDVYCINCIHDGRRCMDLTDVVLLHIDDIDMTDKEFRQRMRRALAEGAVDDYRMPVEHPEESNERVL